MVAYSFNPIFVGPILAGTKRQTIRAERKRHARPGEAMQLYTGMRTKQCALIALATCERVLPIRLRIADPSYAAVDLPLFALPAGLDDFARSDGFEDFRAMRRFWEVNHPKVEVFSGVLLLWGELVVRGARLRHDAAARPAQEMRTTSAAVS
jgi:hypothetical protein